MKGFSSSPLLSSPLLSSPLLSSSLISHLSSHLALRNQARFIEKLSIDRPISVDGSTKLEADIQSTTMLSLHHENVHIHFHKVSIQTYAIVLLVDGGERNFKSVQKLTLYCSQENSDDAHSLARMAEGGFVNVPLFQFSGKPRRDHTAVISSILYKNGNHNSSSSSSSSSCNPPASIWYIYNLFEGIYAETSSEKDKLCHHAAVTHVPTFHKYRPRIFPSVKALCEALSSTSLPSLKTAFLQGGQKNGGLNIREFTEAIFRHLYLSYPKILEHEEAANTVAVIQVRESLISPSSLPVSLYFLSLCRFADQEMFCQMNFNEDPIVDWEEFTTFCIQTDVSESLTERQHHKLDTYLIEYSEDTHQHHDTRTLSSFAPLAVMKYVPTEKRILTIQDSGTQVLIFDEKFRHYSVINPMDLTNHNSNATVASEKIEKCKIYDCCYLASKDCYAYCASDHSIVLCKEHSTGKKIYYTIINKLYVSTSHLKLCWSDKKKILCSIDTENIIYGWDIELMIANGNAGGGGGGGLSSGIRGNDDSGSNQLPLFQITRHQDLITDFIAIDSHDLFLTCSLDKRIVMWSQSTRRVRGVLLGHKRGVKCMSYAKDILLTAGYESNARVWNLHSKELLYILSGHRHPIQTGKLMSPNSPSAEMRAITIDQSGEFRLWNCSPRERSNSQYAEVLQIFSLKIRDGGSDQVAKVRFLEFPYDSKSSIGVYSNIIAGSPGLVHVIPEKTINEFIPPTTVCCAEPNGFIITACGSNLYKYDLCEGIYNTTFPLQYHNLNPQHLNHDTTMSEIQEVPQDQYSGEVTCSCGDGYYTRRMYVGFSSGRLAIINFTTGKVIETVMVNTKGISCISLFKSCGINLLYVGSPDGRISCIEDTATGLNIHLTAGQVIGDNCGINKLLAVESLNLIVASSGGRYWGIWDSMTFRRIFLLEEEGIISDICLLGSSGDKADVDERMSLGLSTIEPGHSLTVAVCSGVHINIYTADSLYGKIAFTHQLLPHQKISTILNPSSTILSSAPALSSSRIPASLYLSGLIQLRAPDTKSLNYSSLTPSSKSNLLKQGNLLVASSDEGYLVIWSIQHIRKDSKKKFHTLYPILLATTTANIPTSNDKSLDSSTHQGDSHPADLFLEDNSAIPSSHPPQLHPTFITYGPDGTIEGGHLVAVEWHEHHDSNHPHHAAPHSLHHPQHPHPWQGHQDPQTSQRRYSSFYEMKKDHQPLRGTHPSTLVTPVPNVTSPPSGRETIHQVNSRREKLKKEMVLKKSQSMFQVEANNLEVGGYDSFVTEYSLLSFHAHSDIITCLVPLNDSGCILTASMDGYHRIWNMDTDCLGELPLPNLSEKLKQNSLFSKFNSYGIEEEQTWKFILERIPVTISHRDIARKLILLILNDKNSHTSNHDLSSIIIEQRDRRRATKNALLYGGATITDLLRLRNQTKMSRGVDSEMTKERLQILTELCAPRPFDEDDNWRGLIPADLSEVSMINSQYSQSHAMPRGKDDHTIETRKSMFSKEVIAEDGEEDEDLGGKVAAESMHEQQLQILIRPKTSSSSTSVIPKLNKAGHHQRQPSGNKSMTQQRPSTATVSSSSVKSHILPTSIQKKNEASDSKAIFRKGFKSEEKINKSRSSSTIQHPPPSGENSNSVPLVTQVNPNVSVITQTSKATVRITSGEVEVSTRSHKPVSPSLSSTQSLWKSPTNMGCFEEAFSLTSISESKRRGLINSDEFKTLTSINKDEERVQAFHRQVPQFLIRNTALSTRVAVPRLEEVSHAEMMFGKQKHMYKNANATFHHTKSAKAVQQQHTITLSRINQAAKRIGTMVHIFAPPKVDEIDVVVPSAGDPSHSLQRQSSSASPSRFPSVDEDDNGNTEPKGVVDLEKIQKIMKKVAEAEISSVPEWERQQHKTEAHLNRHKQKKMVTDSTMIMLLERQLITSIKRFYDKSSTNVKQVTLSAKTLLPFYKISDITHFLEVFQKVDTNLSGDLDVDEWCHFFTALNKNISRKQARIIFNRVDTGGKGTLSIRDLIPVVFGSCNKSIQHKIFQYVECELSKRRVYGKDLIMINDLEKLFECYDYDAVGFISVGLIREKIKSYQLPDSIIYTVMDETIGDLSDEDMINSLEFTRMFRNYCMEYM